MPKIEINTTLKPRIAISKLANPPSVPTQAKDIAKTIAKVKAEEAPTTKDDIEDFLLDNEEVDLSPYSTVSEKLAKIDQLLAAENLPVDRLRVGLKDVMGCIKNVEGSIMELEPNSIKLIVQGYVSIADAEVQTIVAGKTKTAKKKSVATKTKLAKDMDLANLKDDEDF